MKTVYDRIPQIDNLPTRKRASFPDIVEEDFWELYETVKPYSMLHITGFYNLYTSIKYVAQRGIPGCLVECGVWMGGAAAFAALARDRFGLGDRKVWLFDTFTGFPEGSADVKLGQKVDGPSYRSFRLAVEANIEACQVDRSTLVIVEGPVESTLRQTVPEEISVLRLDTDFYSSTKAEMEVLYPRLSAGGVLIVDDYGYYEGSRRAVDEALGGAPIMLARIDTGVRCGVKE